MLLRIALCKFVFVGCVMNLAMAQDAAMPEMPKPTEQHALLKQFEGNWEGVAQCFMAPEQNVQCHSKVTSKMIGDFWVQSEFSGDMGGVTMKGVQTIGFDRKSEKFIGTWVDSMSDHMWKYQGTFDKTGKVLTLDAEGPDMTNPTKMAKYQDIYDFSNDGKLKIKSQVLGSDGQWTVMMSGESTRQN